jgi:uncharacterized Zn-binding protein involved in type VI secretion
MSYERRIAFLATLVTALALIVSGAVMTVLQNAGFRAYMAACVGKDPACPPYTPSGTTAVDGGWLNITLNATEAGVTTMIIGCCLLVFSAGLTVGSARRSP